MENSAVGEWIAAIAAGVTAIGLAMRRWVQKDRVNEANSKAEVDVVTMLRDEVNRLAESNSRLTKQVQELMAANMVLQGTVHALQMQVKTLQVQATGDSL